MTPDALRIVTALKIPPTIVHTGQRTLLEHMVSVYDGLGSWGLSVDICRAGLIHSIYGSERHDRFKIDIARRLEVVDLVGPEAEGIAYAHCGIQRKEFDETVQGGGRRFQSRFGGVFVFVDEQLFLSFCAVHLADWLDQVPFTKEWNHRFEVYFWIARTLGGAALNTFNWVYRGRRT
jgi:hypothetical protein